MASRMNELFPDDEEVTDDQLADPPQAGEDVEDETSLQASEVPVEAEAEEEEAPPEPEPKVSLHALHEERARRRELEQELRKTSELTARMEERFKALTEKFEGAQKPAEPEVDYEENPAEFLRRQNEELRKRLEQVETGVNTTQQTEQQRAQYQQFYERVTTVEQDFAAKQPDYYDAVAHLRDERLRELQTIGHDPQVAQQIAMQDAHAIAANALQQGRNPAQAFYELAKLRGYRPGSKDGQPAQQGEASKLEQIKRASAKSQGLGSAGGDSGELTLAKLAQLDDDAFEKATSGDNWRKLWQ